MVKISNLIALCALIATPALAQDYSDRGACMADLSKFIGYSEAFSDAREIRSHQFETVPDFGDDNVEVIIRSFEEIESAWKTIADEMFALCAKYPD